MQFFTTIPATASDSKPNEGPKPGTVDDSSEPDLVPCFVSEHTGGTFRERCSTDKLMQMFSANDRGSGKSESQSPKTIDTFEVNPRTPEQLPGFIGLHSIRQRSSVVSMPGQVTEKYKLLNKLGEGGFGYVTHVEERQAGKHFALKTVPRQHVDDAALFERELEVARLLKHPYIIRLYQIFRDDEAFHLIMELCTGPDLHKVVLGSIETKKGARRSHGLEPPLVARYLWQMLSGLAYLHNYGMAHRDIKPANYMLLWASSTAPLRLVDFGLACCTNDRMWGRVGSCHYAAPEVFFSEDGYTEKCDIWGLGVTVCVLVTATYPFNGVNQNDVFQRSNEAKYSFLSERWTHHSPLLKDLVAKLLNRDPEKRPSAREAMESNRWLGKFNEQQHACCVLH